MGGLGLLVRHPLLLAALAGLIALGLRRVCPRGLLRGAALLSVALAAAGALLYAAGPRLYDHVSPQILAVSWLGWQGQAIYPDPAGPLRTGLHYGPALYLIHGAAFRLLGPSIALGKVVAAAAALATLLLARARAGQVGGARPALLATGWLAASLLLADARLPWVSCWVRAEPFLLLAATAGCWAAGWERPGRAALGLGLALGACVGLKLHGALYLLPALASLAGRSRPAAAAAAGLGAVAALLPFLVWPACSLTHYLHWLGLASRHPFHLAGVAAGAEWLVWLALPALVAGWRPAPGERLATGALALAAVLALVPAAKQGAGPHHLLPFLPALLGPLTRSFAAGRGGGRARGLALAAALGALAGGGQLVRAAARPGPPAAEVIADLRAASAAHPGWSLELAPGGDASYPLTFYRPELVFLGHPYRLDPAAEMDFALSGPPLAAGAAAALLGGERQLWLVPRGDEPFSLGSYDHPERPLYPGSWRSAFANRERRVGSTRFFDLYGPAERRSGGASFPGGR